MFGLMWEKSPLELSSSGDCGSRPGLRIFTSSGLSSCSLKGATAQIHEEVN